MPKWLPAITLDLPTALPPSTGERAPGSRCCGRCLLLSGCRVAQPLAQLVRGAGMLEPKWFLLLSLLKLGEGAVIPPLPQSDFRHCVNKRRGLRR